MTQDKTKAVAAPPKQETTAIVQYGDWTEEQQEKDSKEMSGSGEWWKPPVGKSSVRFLPPKVGWPGPFVVQHQHFINMPGIDRAIIFCCPKMHENKKCLACAKADTLEASGNAKDEKQAQKLRPQKRMMANVVINSKKPDSKVQVWAFGKTIYDQLKAIRQDDENGGNFLDPIKGFNLGLTRTGTGRDDTRYTIISAREQTKLANMDWIEVQKDLRRTVRIPTVEQQERLFDGEDPRDVFGSGRPAAGNGQSSPSDSIDVDGSEVRTAEDDLYDDEVDVD